MRIQLNGRKWALPTAGGTRIVNFDDLSFDDEVTTAAMEYIAWLMPRRSGQSPTNTFSALLKYAESCRRHGTDPVEIESLSSFKAEEVATGTPEYVRHVRDWYIWASSQYTWPSFSEDYVLVLERWVLPVDEPYLAIRQAETDKGPLHPTEDAVLKRAFRNTSVDAEIIRNVTGRQIRAFAALLRTTGIRPQQGTWIKRSDYRAWERNGVSVAVLAIPRAKNGQAPRTEFRQVRLTEPTKRLIEAAIADIPEAAGQDPWLFSRQSPCEKQIALGWAEEAWRAKTIDQGMRAWSEKLGLTSPNTGKPIWLSPKRIRYTYATALAPKVSPAELAAALDHKDARSISHYYTYAADFYDRLSTIDGAKKWGAIARTFLGLVGEPAQAPGGAILAPPELADDITDIVGIGGCGSDKLCRLFPPFSCYLCPRFRPDPDADHDAVLRALLRWRSKRPASVNRTRDPLQDQLDDVIEAIGHLLVVLAAYHWLRERRNSGAPRPSITEAATAIGAPVDLLAEDKSLRAYMLGWPELSLAQRRIRERNRRK